LGRQFEEIKSTGTEVLLILGAKVERAQKYAESLHLPFPVLSDPERQVYRRYGLNKALLVMQRTASILLDRDGIIRYIHTATNPMTWLSEHRVLIQKIREIADQRG
jgi:peroxiredoxin